jgi:GAF domain-containing protein
MDSDARPAEHSHPEATALAALVTSAAANIPGVDFASITVHSTDRASMTLAATDQVATDLDELQYRLREGPCYAAVTEQRFVLANDLATGDSYRDYGPRANERGVRAQAAIQLSHGGEVAGLNLYSRTCNAFDQSTVQIAELFAVQAAVLLGYARQVETLGQAVHTRQDIGTAVGILMERYQIDRDRAFALLVRISNDRNIKVRELAQHVIDGMFQAPTGKHGGAQV